MTTCAISILSTAAIMVVMLFGITFSTSAVTAETVRLPAGGMGGNNAKGKKLTLTACSNQGYNSCVEDVNCVWDTDSLGCYASSYCSSLEAGACEDCTGCVVTSGGGCESDSAVCDGLPWSSCQPNSACMWDDSSNGCYASRKCYSLPLSQCNTWGCKIYAGMCVPSDAV